jgi:hypothetical protein
MHVSFAKREQERLEESAELHKRRLEEEAKERALHNKTRGDMVVKLFSEKISPGVHDLAAKKEGFGAWKEQFMHASFEVQQDKLKRENKAREEAEARRLEEERQERALHNKTRGDMVVKLFSEKISPGIHDIAAKKEAFGLLKEHFMHTSFELRELDLEEERLRREKEKEEWDAQNKKERKLHLKTRGDMVIKYFSEKISPAVHDIAAKKEAFGAMKQVYLHECFTDMQERVTKKVKEE